MHRSVQVTGGAGFIAHRLHASVVVGASALWLAVNARWLAVYRSSGLLNIDESGYTGIAAIYYLSGQARGLGGWLDAVLGPGIQAPLTTAVTSVIYQVTGPRLVAGFVVVLACGLATVLLTAAVAGRVAGRTAGWIAAIVMGTTPLLLDYSRSFAFAAPAAAVTTAAVMCLICSDGMRRTGWALGFGLFLGLMPLTRTMTIAFVPPLLVAAVLQAALPTDRVHRLVRTTAAVAVGGAVAATWMVRNGAAVLDYLRGYGYGTHTAEYAVPGESPWRVVADRLLNDLQLPHATLLFAGLMAAAITVALQARTVGLRRTATSIVASPLLPPVVLTIGGFAALSSSSTTGSGFDLPLVPGIVLIATWGLTRATRWMRHRPRATVLGLAVALAAIPGFVPSADLALAGGGTETSLPVLGRVVVTDGAGLMFHYEAAGLGDPSLTRPWSTSDERRWVTLSGVILEDILEQPVVPRTAFAFRHYLLNVNTVQLSALTTLRRGLELVQIDPISVGSSEASYDTWLTTGAASSSCILLTAGGGVDEFPPFVDESAMERTATSSGFVVRNQHPLPDGRTATLWSRNTPQCAKG